MQHAEQLQAITAATEAVTAGLELGDVLQQVVNASRRLVRARYAALGVLNEEGDRIEQFITSGMDDATRREIGPYPQGLGLLGHIIRHRRPLRVDDMRQDERAAGFPPHHPIMISFLGVPIVSKDRVFGNLYLTDKVTEAADMEEAKVIPFSEEDQRLVELFARQAAIAIENALLHRQRRQLAIAQERERFAMDLHDGIIQSIYAVGLTLDESRYQLERDQAVARAGIDEAIVRLNDVIADIRNYILNLRTRRFAGQDLASGLELLVREVRAHSFLNVQVHIDPAASDRITPAQTSEILHIAQEALTNVRKHARATTVRIELLARDAHVMLRISDNGSGFDPAGGADDQGNGLHNMRARAASLSGQIDVHSNPRDGTSVTIAVPVAHDHSQD